VCLGRRGWREGVKSVVRLWQRRKSSAHARATHTHTCTHMHTHTHTCRHMHATIPRHMEHTTEQHSATHLQVALVAAQDEAEHRPAEGPLVAVLLKQDDLKQRLEDLRQQRGVRREVLLHLLRLVVVVVVCVCVCCAGGPRGHTPADACTVSPRARHAHARTSLPAAALPEHTPGHDTHARARCAALTSAPGGTRPLSGSRTTFLK
jgi:hypothetical protein